MQNKTLEHELKEADKYKNAIDFLKEEIKKTKQDYHMQALELDKQRAMTNDYQEKIKKLEKKYSTLEIKHQGTLETIEIV